MRLITLLLLGLAATAVAQTITVTGPIGPLYCGFTYTITWTSTALASNTPLTIQLWNNNVGPRHSSARTNHRRGQHRLLQLGHPY